MRRHVFINSWWISPLPFFVSSSLFYNWYKINIHILYHNIPIPDRPWQSIGLDFMGPLPKSNNFDYLLVVIDRLTSQVHLVPTMMTVTARGIMWLILKKVVRLHGIPESIVSDRDTKFTSIFCYNIFVFFIWCENTQYYFLYVEVQGVCMCT